MRRWRVVWGQAENVPLGWNGGQEMMHRHNICILRNEGTSSHSHSGSLDHESDDNQ